MWLQLLLWGALGALQDAGVDQDGAAAQAADAPLADSPVTAVSRSDDARVIRAWWALAPVDGRGRRPFRPDAVFARYLLAPDAPAPSADDTLVGEREQERRWEPKAAEENGRVGGRLGYAYARVDCDEGHVRMAKLSGAWTLFVNGEAFVGDAYGYGFGGVPIPLRAGTNELFVTGIRGGFRLELVPIESRLVVGTWDVTAADLPAGSKRPQFDPFAVPVFNASTDELHGLSLRIGKLVPADQEGRALPERPHDHSELGGAFEQRIEGYRLAPLAVEKPVLAVIRDSQDPLPAEPAKLRVDFELSTLDEDPEVTRASVELNVRAPEGVLRHVFRSRVDGSLQRLAARPATDPEADPGLVMSLHGAGVDSRNQVTSYAGKEDFWIVAPTNRRPFGFDWQDWGRVDFYEALAIARELSGVRDARVYLTGHSMGGHGTWHVAANDPDLFAAIAPSAGWESFDTYGSRPEGSLRALWHAADGTSSTRSLLGNLAAIPTFILHGEADRTVPADEARRMHAALTERGASPALHLEPDQGHWWSLGRSGGADCVDWPEIFELFRATPSASAKSAREEWSWTSIDPAVDSSHRDVHLVQPQQYGEPSTVVCVRDREAESIELTTENVAWLWIGTRHEALERVQLDGAEFESLPANPSFRRSAGEWQLTEGSDRPPYVPGEKSPAHSGPFKRAFDHRFVLVYATGGTESENATSLARARYDQQQWWYRANAAVPLVSDRDFIDPTWSGTWRARNVIVYGNADTNLAWEQLVGTDSPIQARRGKLLVGDREYTGDDLAAMFVRPRADGLERYERALVGVFADTGATGARVGSTLAHFVSGVGIPDYAVFDSSVLTRGDDGVLAAGWWNAGWKFQSEFEHRRTTDPR